jgi:hypothetical protein
MSDTKVSVDRQLIHAKASLVEEDSLPSTPVSVRLHFFNVKATAFKAEEKKGLLDDTKSSHAGKRSMSGCSIQ